VNASPCVAFGTYGEAPASQELALAALPFQLGRGLLIGLGPQAEPKTALSQMLGGSPAAVGACGVSSAGASLPELYAEAAQMLEVSRFYPKMGPVFAESARQTASGPHPISDEDRRAQAKALRTFDRDGYQRLVLKLFSDVLPSHWHFAETGRRYIGALRVLDSVAFSFSLDASRPPSGIEAFSDVGEMRGALLGAFDALAGAFAEKLGRFTLEDSLRYISENLDSVDLAAVANRMDLSYTYFSQLFKKSTGQSFTKYIGAMKMKSALKLLGSGKKIAATASMLGYVNPKNFARAFKSYYGIAPSRWRSLRPESAERGPGIAAPADQAPKT
jgi:AraC-like DNA-binding protein